MTEEVNYVDTDEDQADGMLEWRVVADAFEFRVEATAQKSTASIRMHAAPPKTRGPEIARLVTTRGLPESVSVAGRILAADVVGPVAGDFAAFRAQLCAGSVYVSVYNRHDVRVARAQLQLPDCSDPAPTPSAPDAGTGLSRDPAAREAWLPVAGTLLLLAAAGVAVFTRRS